MFTRGWHTQPCVNIPPSLCSFARREGNPYIQRIEYFQGLAELGRLLSPFQIRDKHNAASRFIRELFLCDATLFAEEPYRFSKLIRIVKADDCVFYL